MLRETLDRKIEELNEDILALEGLVRSATLGAVKALMRRDLETSKKIYSDDHKVNSLRFEIEEKCLIAIATQQPMAADLRILASILEVAAELERIGDYAKGIARINFMLSEDELLEPLDDLPRMAEIAMDMLSEAIKAFVGCDAESARAIPDRDDEVDDLFNKLYRDLVSNMVADSQAIDRANHLQWAVHNIERMADRVTNICERTIFNVTGVMDELDRTDDETKITFS